MKSPGLFRSRTGITLIIFLIIIGYFLWTEHQAHLIGAWPLLLILGLCLGLHFFMHGGHGNDGNSENDQQGRS